jgi:pyruvate dehydrogenase E1 component alpha subunit
MTKQPKVSQKETEINMYDKATYLDWYETMLRIRLFEETVLSYYGKGAGKEIKGFCHVYIGQEAIAAGMKTALKKEDAVVTAYRQHGIAISRGISTESAMAELFGRRGGVVKGKGGSMHFFSKEHRFFGGNGIVGAQIPIGTGIAFAEKYRGTDLLCVTMFGDGGARQGALYESFNMAMTWKIPVLYICENNKYAMGTSVERTSNVHELYKIGSAFDMPSEPVDGMSPEAVHAAIAKAAAHIRAGKGPYFLEINTYRYKGHSVSDPELYRKTPEGIKEMEHFKSIDPIVVTRKKLIDFKIATPEEIAAIDTKVEAEIDAAVEFAKASPISEPHHLYEDNYMQTDYPFMTE